MKNHNNVVTVRYFTKYELFVCTCLLHFVISYLQLLSSRPLAHKAFFIIVSLVSVIDIFFYGLRDSVGPEPTSLRRLDGLISDYPSPRRFCLKRLSEHRLPRLGIKIFFLLRYSRSAVPYSVIFGTISPSRPARDFLHPPPGGRAPTPLYPARGITVSWG